MKIRTLKEIREIWKRLTPEQRKAIQAQIADLVADLRRSQFELIPGGRRKRTVTESMNALAREITGLEPDDPRRAEIIKEMSQLSLHSAWSKRRTTDG